MNQSQIERSKRYLASSNLTIYNYGIDTFAQNYCIKKVDDLFKFYCIHLVCSPETFAIEIERKAKEEAERKAKEAAERKVKEAAEHKVKEAAERKAKEEAERKAKEEAERNSYKSLIEEFVSDTKECEYKDGIIFGKKKTIKYVANPITKHIWNAVVNKSAESDFDDDEYVPQKELGDFIKELNAHFIGRVVFEYLHKNIHANVHLQVYEKLDKNACFVYIKEDNR